MHIKNFSWKTYP